jgi:hypothetical protein
MELRKASKGYAPAFLLAASLELTCILNLIVAVAGIFVIGRLFEQEKIINR